MEKSKFIMCFFLVVFLTTNFTYSQSKKSDNTLIKELISKKRSFNKEYSYGFSCIMDWRRLQEKQ